MVGWELDGVIGNLAELLNKLCQSTRGGYITK